MFKELKVRVNTWAKILLCCMVSQGSLVLDLTRESPYVEFCKDAQCFNLTENSQLLKLSSEIDNLRIPRTTVQD